MQPPAFDDLDVPAPDPAHLEQRVRSCVETVWAARGVDDAVAAVREWNDARITFLDWENWVDLRFAQDTRDADRKAARERCDALRPRFTEWNVAVERALLEHPLRADLERCFGRQAFALWEREVQRFDPVIADDLVRESELTARYTELVASAEFEFEGETHNFPTLRRFEQDPDRAKRHAAARLRWGWCAEHLDELDGIYDELVGLRHGMARKLGKRDFVELGYDRMNRVDYGREDVERFRAQVREHVVPVCAELARRQARTLGLDGLKLWDERLLDPAGNPRPKGGLEWMTERAHELFAGVGHGMDGFFRSLVDGGYLDLESRKGKAGGGFCTSFPSIGMPYVFANFNGTKGDVEVFTHELGHAFQCWSSREQPLVEYLWPTLESCEVHSMSLEFLALPWIERFFGEDAPRFVRAHVTESLIFLPYGTAVDEFQHRVYERPEMSPAERRATWRELERTYMPWRDPGDLEHVASGGYWQTQAHVYRSPFYYIDYVLAGTCAMQFWVRAEEDREAAMRDYVALCRRGGEAPFQELVRGAGLTSPFDDGCLEAAVARCAQELGLG